MLAYLNALCAALLSRNEAAIRDLLAHPLAATLPPGVSDEAYRVLDREVRPYSAPLQALRLYHQTAHLLGTRQDPASNRARPTAGETKPERLRQMELPLQVKVA